MQGDRRDDGTDLGASGMEAPDRHISVNGEGAVNSVGVDDGAASVSRDAALSTDASRLPLGDDAADSRPWLEAADDGADREVSSTKLALLGIVGLLIIASIVGGLWHLQSGGRKGREELIAAQPGSYKVRPAESGAKVFEGQGSARYAASEGLAPGGRIDPRRVAEEPAVVTSAAPTAPAAATASGAASATPVKPAATAASVAASATAAPAAMPATNGAGLVQLGAFGSAATAAKSWASLQKRFAYLAPLSSSVTPVERGGKTVFRLRVAAGSAAAADSLCQRLKVAGESCIRVD